MRLSSGLHTHIHKCAHKHEHTCTDMNKKKDLIAAEWVRKLTLGSEEAKRGPPFLCWSPRQLSLAGEGVLRK